MPDDTATLCRLGDATCGACCWGAQVERSELRTRLRRHRRSPLSPTDGRLDALRCLLHELRMRRGLDLLLAALLWLPAVGARVRRRIGERTVCAFVAFENESETRVGCLLHPERTGGHDRRRQFAYRLLRGVGCGSATYLCAGATRFRAADTHLRSEARASASCRDWFDFSRWAPAWRPPHEE